MRRVLLRRWLSAAGAVLLAINAVAPLAAAWAAIGTLDTNQDGRPDVWRYYDVDGRLVRVDVDGNYDGRPDETHEFNPVRGTRVRVEIDVDFDGQPDEVSLFRDGRLVRTLTGGPLRTTAQMRALDQFLHEVPARVLPAGAIVQGDGRSSPLAAAAVWLPRRIRGPDQHALSPQRPRGPPSTRLS